MVGLLEVDAARDRIAERLGRAGLLGRHTHFPAQDRQIAHCPLQRARISRQRAVEHSPLLQATVGLRDDAVVEAYLSYAAESLAKIVDFIPAEKLCIENLEYISFDKIFPLVDKFDTRICMDVGHIRLRNEDVGDFVKVYGPRLGHVHMHDVTWKLFDKRIRVMDDHQGLGSGIVDVEAVIRMLRTAGFDGPVVLEVHTVDPIDSVRVLKDVIDKVK